MRGPKQVVFVGDRFGRLLVIAEAGIKSKARQYECLCDCGAVCLVISPCLRGGTTQSCGCYRREATSALKRIHGLSESRVYRIWHKMLTRCRDPKTPQYPHYGGRGIKVCDRWMSFQNFVDDMGMPPDRMSLDRIDVNGNYEPTNCRWASQKEQTRNTRRTRYAELNGVKRPLIEWSEMTGIPYSMLRDRLARGWDFARAISEPRRG